MANRIKGITLEINGSVTGLDKALKEVNSSISQTGKALKDVNRLLKIDPKNTELLSQKQRLLKESVDETKKKLEQLKEADKVAKQQLDSGDLGQDKYDALQREIVEIEEKLQSLEKEYKDFGTVAGQQMQQIGQSVKDTGDKIAGVGKEMTTKVTVPMIPLVFFYGALSEIVDSKLPIVKSASSNSFFTPEKAALKSKPCSVAAASC